MNNSDCQPITKTSNFDISTMFFRKTDILAKTKTEKMTIKDLYIFIANKTAQDILRYDAHDNHKIILAVKYISVKLNLSSRIVENWGTR